MRMWMVDPELLCIRHLLGEHVECHMFVGALREGKSLKGYLSNNLFEPLSLISRHDALAREMVRRGMKHESPIIEAKIERLTQKERETLIDKPSALRDLLGRCTECQEGANWLITQGR